MPIQEDIMDHSVIGPAIRQGLAQGLAEGRVEGERALLLRQIAKRFGGIEPAMRHRLDKLTPAELEEAGLRLLDARNIEELFRQ